MTPHSVYAKTFRDKQAALGLTQLCVWVPADQLGQIKALIKGLRPAETVTLQPEANLLNDEQQSGPMNAMAWFRDSCSDYIKETIAQPKPKKHQSVEYVTLAALLKMDETQDFTEEMFVKSGGDQSVLNADDEPDEPSKAEATQPQPVLKPEENLPNNDDATQPAPVEQLVPSDPSRDLEVSGIRLQYVDDWTNEEDGSRGPRYVGKLNGFEVVFVWPYEWVEDEVQWWLTIGGDDIFAPSLEEADAIGDGDGLRYVLDSAPSLEHAIEDTKGFTHQMVIAARSGWKYIQTIGYGAHYVAEWDGYKVDFWTSSKHVSTFASSKHVSDENYVAWRIQAPNARMSRAESLKEATENAKRAIERRLGMKPHEVIQAILVS